MSLCWLSETVSNSKKAIPDISKVLSLTDDAPQFYPSQYVAEGYDRTAVAAGTFPVWVRNQRLFLPIFRKINVTSSWSRNRFHAFRIMPVRKWLFQSYSILHNHFFHETLQSPTQYNCVLDPMKMLWNYIHSKIQSNSVNFTEHTRNIMIYVLFVSNWSDRSISISGELVDVVVGPLWRKCTDLLATSTATFRCTSSVLPPICGVRITMDRLRSIVSKWCPFFTSTAHPP